VETSWQLSHFADTAGNQGSGKLVGEHAFVYTEWARSCAQKVILTTVRLLSKKADIH